MGTTHAAAPIRPTLSFCVEQMAARGHDPARLLAGSGLRQDSYQQPQAVVSPQQELLIYRNILSLAGTDAIGLELGRAVHLNSIGILGALLSNAADLGHAGYLMRRFHLLSSPWFVSELIGELEPGKLLVRYKQTSNMGNLGTLGDVGDPGGLYRLIIDRDIRGTLGLLVRIFGAGAAGFISGIAFGYRQPANARRYRAEFGCPVSFGHEYTYVTFDNSLAGLKNPQRCGIAYNIYLRLCRDALSDYAPASWHRRVTNLLSSGDDYPKAEDMAARLNCSERSLRRHLNAEGFQYSELVDRVRFDRAAYLLTHSRDPIKKIGFQLRYSEPPNFVHAFTRWAGMSPTRFRDAAIKMK